jgi:hypothetical protein
MAAAYGLREARPVRIDEGNLEQASSQRLRVRGAQDDAHPNGERVEPAAQPETVRDCVISSEGEKRDAEHVRERD